MSDLLGRNLHIDINDTLAFKGKVIEVKPVTLNHMGDCVLCVKGYYVDYDSTEPTNTENISCRLFLESDTGIKIDSQH